MGTLLVEYISVKKEWKGYIHNPKFLVAAMGLNSLHLGEGFENIEDDEPVLQLREVP